MENNLKKLGVVVAVTASCLGVQASDSGKGGNLSDAAARLENGGPVAALASVRPVAVEEEEDSASFTYYAEDEEEDTSEANRTPFRVVDEGEDVRGGGKITDLRMLSRNLMSIISYIEMKENQIHSLERQIDQLTQENEQLHLQNEELRGDAAEDLILRLAEVDRLRGENEELRGDAAEDLILRLAEVDRLRGENEALRKENADLRSELDRKKRNSRSKKDSFMDALDDALKILESSDDEYPSGEEEEVLEEDLSREAEVPGEEVQPEEEDTNSVSADD